MISHEFGQDVSSSSLDALEHFIPLLPSKETLTDESPIQHKKLFRLRDCEQMKKEISTKGVDIEDEVLSNDFYEIMENNNNVMFKKTKKLANGNPNTIKYHPLMIRFCISLAAKSASAYDELRSCGILNCKVEKLHMITQILYIKASAGFNPQVIKTHQSKFNFSWLSEIYVLII